MHAFHGRSLHIPSCSTSRHSFANAPRSCLRHARPVCQAATGTSLTFNIAETSITFPFDKDQARQLSSSITELIQTFAAKQKAERPKRWKMMEYKYQNGDGHSNKGLEFFEVVCNPNAYATAFDAKVLITMRSSQGLKVTTEGRLSNLKGDVDTFLDS
ncbi:MAG: hypothetical protein FRX49_00289 [Trebouxia sp. A1-2]|nr:MAG: hypothetical protein FRX49_00289 [Trebouxia sp. A1-2]